MITVTLSKGKDKPIRMGHPWVFSGALARVGGSCEAGELCEVRSAENEIVGRGFYNEHSAIRVRMLTRGGEIFDDAVLSRRIADAVAVRRPILSDGTDCCRLVNSEGDRLPGLIVDKYGPGLSVQVLTAGMERFRKTVMESLQLHCAPSFVYERSDTDARFREGLPPHEGSIFGEAPHDLVVCENGLRFYADVAHGQKTGFYLDQRENRKLFFALAAGRTVADCFCYSGGFSTYGLSGGAHFVSAIDISKDAVASAEKNFILNRFDPGRFECHSADVFDYLRQQRDRRYDCIVLDPPKFAKHKAEVDRAARGYKDINLLAMKMIAAGGILFTFSCSNAVDSTLFRQIVFAAAADSRRDVQVLHVLSAGPDHPFNIAHREGEYLKGLVLRVN